MVIDFHVHTFPAKISLRALESMSQNSRTVYFTDGTTDQLQQSMQRCGVDYSVNLPVMTNPGQVEKVNSSMIRDRETLAARGIIAFGGMRAGNRRCGYLNHPRIFLLRNGNKIFHTVNIDKFN